MLKHCYVGTFSSVDQNILLLLHLVFCSVCKHVDVLEVNIYSKLYLHFLKFTGEPLNVILSLYYALHGGADSELGVASSITDSVLFRSLRANAFVKGMNPSFSSYGLLISNTVLFCSVIASNQSRRKTSKIQYQPEGYPVQDTPQYMWCPCNPIRSRGMTNALHVVSFDNTRFSKGCWSCFFSFF